MGVTFTHVAISNPRREDAAPVDLELLVDTGARYSVVPCSVLESLGVVALQREQFTLADGSHQTYDVGEAFFTLGGRAATSKVVVGPEGITPLLGALSLESLGLMVNPVTREPTPMRLFLAGAVPAVRLSA